MSRMRITREEYRNKNQDERHYSHIPSRSAIMFLEVFPSDSSDFEEELDVRGVDEVRIPRAPGHERTTCRELPPQCCSRSVM